MDLGPLMRSHVSVTVLSISPLAILSLFSSGKLMQISIVVELISVVVSSNFMLMVYWALVHLLNGPLVSGLTIDQVQLSSLTFSLHLTSADHLLVLYIEWQICYQAAAAYSLIVISLYETLGPAVVEYCINHSDSRLVLASATHIPKLLTQARACPNLRVIVSADDWDSLEPLPRSSSNSVGDRRSALKQWGQQLGILVLDITERQLLMLLQLSS